MTRAGTTWGVVRGVRMTRHLSGLGPTGLAVSGITRHGVQSSAWGCGSSDRRGKSRGDDWDRYRTSIRQGCFASLAGCCTSIVLGFRRRIRLTIVQCDSILSNWRSEIGKAGYRAVLGLWSSDKERFATPESRRDYVADALNKARFVYKYPDVSDLFTNRNTY